MSAPYRLLGRRDAPVLIVADHASNHVPPGLDLGIDPALLHAHIALDIGVAELAAELVGRHGMAAILGGVSRLVIDYNREEDAPGLVPQESDGAILRGNRAADIAHRIAHYYRPYHAQVAALAGQAHAPFLLSLHSFTPRLATRPHESRPWELGILYNQDQRTAPVAIRYLRELGYRVGDQQPYSGTQLNATMNRHAEAWGRPYLGVEVRQDLAADPARRPRLADDLAALVHHVRQSLA